MARLYLVRHGEAAAGFGDHADPGLSDAGHAQARKAATALAKLGALPAIASPLARAKQTADAYTTHTGVALSINPAFAEVPSPVGLDQRRAWLLDTFPNIADPAASPSRWSRLATALMEWRQSVVLAAQAIPHDTIIFTHFIPINALISAASRSEATIVAWPGYASVTVIETHADGLRLIAPPAEATTVVL